MLLLTRVQEGASYGSGVLPGLVLFGGGLGILVAPLTTAVLASVEENRTGVASGVNNAIARLAGLLATVLLPLAVGLSGLEDLGGPAFADGFVRAMQLGAALCAVAAGLAFLTVTRAVRVQPMQHPSPTHGCSVRRAA